MCQRNNRPISSRKLIIKVRFSTVCLLRWSVLRREIRAFAIELFVERYPRSFIFQTNQYLPGGRLRNRYTIVNDCPRSFNRTYPAVLCHITWLSITIVLHRVVSEGIRSCTIVKDLGSMLSRIVNDECVGKCRAVINDDDKQPFASICRWSCFTVSDTKKYGRNTEPCNRHSKTVNECRCLTWVRMSLSGKEVGAVGLLSNLFVTVCIC